MLNENVDKVIIVDPGKNSVKSFEFSPAYELLGSNVFPSKSEKKRNFYDIDTSSKKQYKVEINHNNVIEKYVVGEGIDNNFDFDTTKNNFHHKLCIYTSIANYVDRPNERIHLVVGYPSSDYVNSIQRKDYEELLKSDEPVTITINGEVKTFIITDVVVLPEGIAFKPRVLNPNRVVEVIDVGGQNINYRKYDQKGNTLESFSLDKAGMNHLADEIKSKLRKFVRADMVNLDAIDYEKAIEDRKIAEIDDSLLTDYPNTSEFMEDAVLTFIEKSVIGQLRSHGVDITKRGNLLIFSGGGSISLKKYFEELLTNNEGNMFFSDTAQWDNCISYAVKDIGDRCKKLNKSVEAQNLGKKVLKQTDMNNIIII